MTITKIVAEEGGYIATTNSDKLPNGKVKGTIVVRIPPDHLDTLVMKLALGDLKSQNLTAEDVTKQYTDTAQRVSRRPGDGGSAAQHHQEQSGPDQRPTRRGEGAGDVAGEDRETRRRDSLLRQPGGAVDAEHVAV